MINKEIARRTGSDIALVCGHLICGVLALTVTSLSQPLLTVTWQQLPTRLNSLCGALLHLLQQ